MDGRDLPKMAPSDERIGGLLRAASRLVAEHRLGVEVLIKREPGAVALARETARDTGVLATVTLNPSTVAVRLSLPDRAERPG
jgi:hypothetical protein